MRQRTVEKEEEILISWVLENSGDKSGFAEGKEFRNLSFEGRKILHLRLAKTRQCAQRILGRFACCFRCQ